MMKSRVPRTEFWGKPASAPALSFHQVCTCFCLISCEPIVAATVCLPSLMLWSLHLIEVESIIVKKRRRVIHGSEVIITFNMEVSS